MYIDYEKIGKILGFGKRFFYNKKIKQNLDYIKRNQKNLRFFQIKRDECSVRL